VETDRVEAAHDGGRIDARTVDTRPVGAVLAGAGGVGCGVHRTSGRRFEHFNVN
jgi:hypothetical protein